MKEMKRVLALLLCVVMLVGYMPVSAHATEGEPEATAETSPVVSEASVEDPSEEPSEDPSKETTEPETIAVTGITLNPTKLEVEMGELPMALTVTVLPENATDKTVTWTSSEPGVVSVDEYGTLTFGYMGKAVVTATAGEHSATCAVTVVEGEAVVYANDATDYLFIATDRHTNTSIIGNIINNMESNIGENELDYLALGGDMVGSSNNHPAYNSSVVLGEVTGATSSLDAENVDIVAGIHDMNVTDDAGIVLPYQGGGAEIYKGDKFYVYGVEEYCISDDSNESNWSSESKKFVEWANALPDDGKVIVVVSHYPLHAKRDDNDGAYYWHQALNTVATGSASGGEVSRNVFFFHGHNHTVDGSNYVYNVGDTMKIQNGSSTTSESIYYTYATAGYLNQNSQATLMTITEDKVTLNRYTTSGIGTSMTSVERVAEAEVTLSSIAVSGTTEYYVGDALALTVTAIYSDGSKVDVTADSDISGYDMSTAGTYTVTAAYGGLTATTSITVADPYVTKIDITTEPTKLTYVTGETLDTTGMVVTATYNNGTTAEVTGWYTSTVDMATVGEKTVTVNYYVNGSTFKDTYTITVEEGVAEGVTLTGIAVTDGPTKTEYLISEELSLDGLVVTATFSDDSTKVIEYAPFATSTVYGGYELDNFSMYVEKEHAVTVTYTFREVTQTATFTINVWNEAFTGDYGVKVVVSAGDYGVTGVNVADSENTYVAAAIEGVIGETYKAYDITLDLDADGSYALTDAAKTVTLPIPEGVNNPVVCYVSDDGATVEQMDITEQTETTVSFETTHFSTYVVGENAVTGEESDTTTPGGSTTTTTYSKEEVTVYKLVTTPVSGKTYLIVNSNTGTGYGLDADTTGYSTTAFNGGDGYYSSWDSSSNTGTAFSAGSDVYLTTSGAYLWTAGSNSFTIGYDSDSSSSLGSTSYTYTLNPANGTSGTWSLSNNQLSISLVTKDSWFGSDTNTTYYLSGGSTWSMSTSASNVYFYEPVTVYKVTTSTSTVETPDTTYHMDLTVDGNAVTDHAYTVTGVESGDTAKLWANFTATANGTTSSVDWPEGGSFTVLSSSNEDVATMGTDGTLTFTGKEGSTLVQVEYTWTVNGVEYKTQNYVIITAQPPVYDLAIADPEATQIKIGATTTLTATATADGSAIDGATITWSSSDTAIATVDASTGVVTGVAAGDVTITATYTDPNGTVHTENVNISVVDAVYELDLQKPVYTEATEYVAGTTYFVLEDGSYSAVSITEFASGVTYYTQSLEVVTGPIVIKDVEKGMHTYVWAVVYKDGEDLGKLTDAQLEKLTWISSNEDIATVDQNGNVTFQGGEGTVTITAIYTYADGKSVTDTVVYSVSADHYIIPDDGTDDFPDYPNEGAIRFDKTATAVGNFSETGIAKVELSMTGVPITTNNAMDVVVMLDMTGSMSDNGMSAAEEATVAFVKEIVKNADGTYNNNRVAVYAFNSGSSSPYELVSLGTISSDSELETANTAIRTASDKQASGGTPFDEATKQCYDVLQAAKTTDLPEEAATAADYDRQQFCVFMSDGGPTTYYGSDEKTYYGGNNNSGDVLLTSCMTGYSSSDSADWEFTLPTEYYTDAMKADGVTVYTVGLLLQTAPSNPAPYSSMTDSTYDSTTDSLTTIGSHYYFTSSILKQMASDESKYIDIFNVDNAAKATAAFQAIAQSILEAATNVKVTDKIADDYTMVFEAPNAIVDEADGDDQEYYIEVIDYALTAVDTDNDGVVDNYVRGTATSLMKLYLGWDSDNSKYYAASDSSGTEYEAPTFAEVTLGTSSTKYYWSTDFSKGDSGISVTGSYTDSDGNTQTTTFYFVSEGNGEYNMTSGAYASGTLTEETVIVKNADGTTTETTNSTSKDLIIATKYFVYNASTRMLVWTAEKLSSSELALSYFLYLDESGGWSGSTEETDAGTYETNDYANLNYTNFNGNDCEQKFPVPQMTWNGAQVSYVFYLVNENGQPVNRAGRVVPFSEAVYVTDVYTHSIVWNDLEQVASLEAEYLAEDLVPEVYELYDAGATYNIHVFEDQYEQNLNNHFVIGSGLEKYTTYVFNTKADAIKYTDPGAYAAAATYKCKEYAEDGQYEDDKGKYNIVTKTDATAVHTGFDFSNTTVAFAVVWKPALVEDVVVVDYGLDVIIDVATNDALASGVVGVRTTAPSGVAINSGVYDAVKDVTVDLYINANHDTDGLKELKIGTATVESLTSVRFALDKTSGMQFSDPATFYYESDVNYYDENSDLVSRSMYSSVTVIPATIVYYEDEYVELKTFTKGVDGTYTEAAGWDTNSVAATAVQAADRPGASKISEAYDADNVYGYDAAYSTMSTYSMGNSAKVNVTTGKYATAGFSFYGTGFDVISLTSNQTGTLTVKVTGVTDPTFSKNLIVDTYYGYTQDADGKWIVSENDPNALYQVPVIKVEGLTYGLYNVVITATYNTNFDHTDAGAYDLYLDAIRIYDPTGNENADALDAYAKDGESYPVYEELRNNIIAASNYEVTEKEDGTVTVSGNNLAGAIFIDCNDATTAIADYVSYGPNNELYLANNQAIAFNLTVTETMKDVQLGIKVANGNSVTYEINGDSYTTTSATDLYYSILEYAKAGTVTIKNVSGGILSLTNIKTTYDDSSATTSLMWMDGESAGVALMSLRAPVVEEETVPETTVPEETESETTVPEETEPEETTPETTVPEETEPEETTPEDTMEQVKEIVQNVVNQIVNALSSLFSKWFN